MTWVYFLTSWQAPVAMLLALFLCWVLVGERGRRQRLRAFVDRPDALASWQAQFPTRTPEAAEEVLEFLRLFADAFGLPLRSARSLNPGDRLMDIYRAKHPVRGCDELEFEILGMELEERYGRDLLADWRDDLTLGDVFEMTRQMSKQVGPRLDLGEPPHL